MQSITISVSVCPFFCLFVCLSAPISQKPHVQIYQIFRICYLWTWLCPSLTAMQGVMYCGFCGWRHAFIMVQMGQNQSRRICFVQFCRWRHRRRSLSSPLHLVRMCDVWSCCSVSVQIIYISVRIRKEKQREKANGKWGNSITHEHCYINRRTIIISKWFIRSIANWVTENAKQYTINDQFYIA